MVDYIAKHKNGGSIKLSWIKSHPSYEALINGSVDSHSSVGNSLADLAASKCHEAQHVEHIQCAFDFLAAKQTAYEELISRCQAMTIKLVKADRILCENKEGH